MPDAVADSHHHHPAIPHVDTWVFDLDNTLYPASCSLFDQVDVLISRYIRDRLQVDPAEADRLRKHYWYTYGTTMNGLMAEHGIDPDEYMEFVHGIDYGIIPESPGLEAVLGLLPGRKYVFTNANRRHADVVLGRIGIAHHFEAIFDIKAASYQPKPKDHFYDTFLDAHGIDPGRSALLEDMAVNLEPGHARGMTTVHIRTGSEHAMKGHDAAYVHHSTHDLLHWLEALLDARDLRQAAG